MVAKRMIPMLHVKDGRVVAQADGADLGEPSAWARRMELEGADELLFVEVGEGRACREAWLADVARALFVPFALEARFGDAAEVAEAFASGADKVVLQAGDLAGIKAHLFGRSRIMAVLDAAWSAESGWTGALEDMVNLGEAGAGEILLRAGTGALGDLCGQITRLAAPVVLLCPDPELAAKALEHGADGIVFPATTRTAAEFKGLLEGAAVTFRQ